MEFTGIQIAFSVIVILSAAGVALLVDFLKGKNEQLREAMVELRVRREEEALRMAAAPRRTAPVAAPVNPRVERKAALEPAPAPQPVMERSATPVAEQAAATMIAKVAASQGRGNGRPSVRENGHQNVRRDSTIDSLVRKPNSTAKVQKPASNPSPVRGQDVTSEWTSVSGRRPTPPPPAVESVPKMDEMASKEALADWLRRRAAARAAQTKQQTVTPPPQVTETPEPVMEPVATAVIEPVSVAPAVTIEQVSSVTPAGLPEVQIDAFLWESLVSGKPMAVASPDTSAPQAESVPQAPVPETQFQLIRGSSSTSDELLVPAGMYDETHLSRLLEINKPFTGLVVSIGVSENDGRPPENEDVMRSTELYVAGLLGENDFGCRSGVDEFVLICSGQQGAEAQRRLSNISERLWDFQLRGLGSFTILFSWGGVDVQNEPLSDAVASATERMHQTKRSRKTVSMDSVSNRRQAV
jgi:hypothetical protein